MPLTQPVTILKRPQQLVTQEEGDKAVLTSPGTLAPSSLPGTTIGVTVSLASSQSQTDVLMSTSGSHTVDSQPSITKLPTTNLSDIIYN